ncbi:hypothetical protein D8Y22_04730 [Salinadaptatus halalkaliphilus]|uniref:Uncharacterized protein n=1 Tax=Salinadaptatus halalkaliphilus TaxID=2419781 RepID=A0A4S3TNT3_9EURY|nr:hypothetical protein [Salinadaptatus halalkaliphilus]THE65984.1 hypothetical protein D8Y22_04730 [Salinadaptatus halalkaliphilus]
MAQHRSEDPFEETYQSFYRRGATDGLPVVTPTEERVDRMLEGTDRDRDEELGTLGTREGVLTVEKLATNAVMAGCLPIHMPVLEAGARALIDPKTNALQMSVSTGSWAYLCLLNGPIRESLDINADTGAFGPGFRSNRTIGRALGLTYKNTARIHPGEKEMSTLGNPFKFSLLAGENEERSPWEPYHVERGYDAEESTITMAAPNSFIQPFRTRVDKRGVLANLIDNTPPRMIGVKSETANERYEGTQTEVFYALCPYNAGELADYTKAEIREHIYENSHVPIHQFDPGVERSEADSDSDGLPPFQRRQFDDPDRINLFVTGGSGRWDAIMGPTLGGPTTKAISLPDNWEDLLETYSPHLEREWGTTTEP